MRPWNPAIEPGFSLAELVVCPVPQAVEISTVPRNTFVVRLKFQFLLDFGGFAAQLSGWVVWNPVSPGRFWNTERSEHQIP
jgi:hypothetical protein